MLKKTLMILVFTSMFLMAFATQIGVVAELFSAST
jgi:hypothetical protein